MKRKLFKKLSVSLLTLTMMVGMVAQTPVYAANEALDIKDESTYALVDVKSQLALNVKAIGWQTQTTVNGEFIEEGSKITNAELFQFVKVSDQSGLEADEVRVKMNYVGQENAVYPMRSESGNDFLFADSEKRSDCCEYIIKKTGEQLGTIRDMTRNYYFSIGDAHKIKRVADEKEALVFRFVENPTVTDFSLYIEHVETGNYVKANGVDTALTVDGKKVDGKIADDLRWTPVFGNWNGPSVTFNSKQYPNTRWKSGSVSEVKQIAGAEHGGWESIRVVPNGNGTISFKATDDGKYFTVSDNKIIKTGNAEEHDKQGEFIIRTVDAPKKVEDVKVSQITDTEVTVSWKGVQDTFYTGYKVVATPSVTSSSDVVTSKETTDTSLRLTGLQRGVEYTITVRTVNADGPFATSESVKIQTKNGPLPAQVVGLDCHKKDNDIQITWNKVEKATAYDIYRARSAFDKDGYQKVGHVENVTEFIDKTANENQYENYYKVVAINENGESDISDEYVSLETQLFGENVFILAEYDDTAKIDALVQKIFIQQNDLSKDAQFNTNRYSIYYKPGNYVDTSCVPVGFYTHIGGLGKTPYDVKLNNIEVPAYLDGRKGSGNYWDDGSTWRNATCNFWRSAENLSVVGTGKATTVPETTPLCPGASNWSADAFSWSVAQAAPLRRVYSTRNVKYDWSFGWASGGYTADCYFTGNADTASGQQYFTRNSIINGTLDGTTLNNFNMGVQSDNLPTTSPLVKGNGYSNWGEGEIGKPQKVLTNVEKTPKVREKPFLFLDDDSEYKIFVPAIRENSTGISWGEGKANDGMGEGKILSLEEFYIAKEGDSAAKINEQLKNGMNIFFTPGVYHAEEVIKVNNPNTILLGTGMASIIPDNGEGAMKIADVSGIIVSGFVFDAGASSQYLLKVGDEGKHTNHSANPTLLSDLFFRIGGTTSELTKAEDALIINSDDVIGDHFWIWRADHGAGVKWYGNESQHGLIVNGDNVNCYALFNEHFQSYHTLWNGDNGATYFYQNETAYDPISQEAWMSHEGTVNGYSSYKVANKVNKHYAVGLGIYNVFINTGEDYDSSKVQIQLDNAIEVPNKKDVLIENACVQTFANDGSALQKINSIVNGVGNGVSSGIDKDTGEKGEGWSRQFLLSYQNGTATFGAKPDEGQKGQFIGLVTKDNIPQPMNEPGDVDFSALLKLVDEVKENYHKENYTTESWASLQDALALARVQIEDRGEHWAIQSEIDAAIKAIQDAVEVLELLPVDLTDLEELYNQNKDKKEEDYTVESWKVFKEVLEKVKVVLADHENLTSLEVESLLKEFENAIDQLKLVEKDNPNGGNQDKEEPNGGNQDKDDDINSQVTPNNPDKNESSGVNPDKSQGVETKDATFILPYAILGVCAACAYVSIKKFEHR